MSQPALSPFGAGAAFWNSEGSRSWTDRHELADRAFAGLARAALARAAPQPGERVLDIGCGSGTTLLELAALVGPDGHVLGADIADRSVARARARIAAASLGNAEVVCADVATHAFPSGAFDLVFSRLGVMFFEDPVAALTNVRQAMRRDGRLGFAVFRTPAENAWPSGAFQAVRHLLPPMPRPGPDDPGMFSWADPARVDRILSGAGFRDVTLSPADVSVQVAGEGGVAEAVAFSTLFGPMSRILPDQPEATVRAVRSALEDYFRPLATPQGVFLDSAFWIVQARP